MCDYDWSYEEISSREVVTRKRHECGSCMQTFPKGTRMMYAVGKTDGEIGSCYSCAACRFALHQIDHAPMHLCWGWAWNGMNDDYPDGENTWNYIHYCLENNETPTETGLSGVLEQHRVLEALLDA